MLTRPHLIAVVLLSATVVGGAASRSWPSSAPPQPGASLFTASPEHPVKFSGTLDRRAVLLGGDGQARIELVMAADHLARERGVRRPTDLVIVLDSSGSMSGEKMEYARAAVMHLISELGADDRFALVTYADAARIAVPLAIKGRDDSGSWAAAVAAVQPEGSTNMSSGLDAAFALIADSRQGGRVPHVILISDGLANAGDPTPEGLMRRARQAAIGEYMLSSVGVGADFNEYLMTAIADSGSGNYHYLRDTRALGEVFAREFDAARTTVASGLAVRIEPAPGVTVIDAAGYPLEHEGGAVVFRPGSLFSGQERRVWVTLLARRDAVGEYDLANFALSYTSDGGRHSTLSFDRAPRVACVEGEAKFLAGVDVSNWSRSVVVDEYNKMKEDVARKVKAGERERALQAIDDFRGKTKAMNSTLQSPPVAAQLGRADGLEADVKAAFEGPGQESRQNELSKAASADALSQRRAGSSK